MTDETSAHPTESIPAFVLGMLGPEEQRMVALHLAACPRCRAEASAFRQLLEIQPAAPPTQAPPQHVKQRLLARVAATRRVPRWLVALSAGALILALVFGVLLLDARARLDMVAGQLAASQRAADDLRRQQLADRQLASFIGAPETVARRLAGADPLAGAVMYMQPANSHAVLVIHGLPHAAPGTTYQFWLARPGAQVPANTFDVDQQGGAVLAIEAPAPVNEYTEVMVTIEPSGGAAQPSGTVVLNGAIARAPRAPPSPLVVDRAVDASRRSAV